jgi:prevent-host-death family protein
MFGVGVPFANPFPTSPTLILCDLSIYWSTLTIMSTVSVSELKANLARYLREVRHGGEVQVLYRGTPVARLTAPIEHDSGTRQRLVGERTLRPGSGDPAAILNAAPLELPTTLSKALEEDRGDRF